MQILNPAHHSYQYADQTPRRDTPKSIKNTSLANFLTAKSVLTIHSILNDQLLFVKDFNDDDVVQIYIDTLEKNMKEIIKSLNYQIYDNDHAR